MITQEQAQEKSRAKIQKIKALAKELNVSITAEQAIMKGNIIKTVVFFTDNEEYDVEKPEPKTVRPPVEEIKKTIGKMSLKEKKDDQDTTLRE